MDKYEELACEIIDRISDLIEEKYNLKPKNLTSDKIREPALINGTTYYGLESEIAQMIKKKR